ncbi:hypothetical protein AHAS_Ahas13G0256500 [Arachis hypogaea]
MRKNNRAASFETCSIPNMKICQEPIEMLNKYFSTYAILAAVLAAVSSAGTITIAVSVAVESFWIENFWIREVDVGPDGKIRYEDFIARMVANDPVFIPVPDNSANKRRKEIVPLQTIRTMSVHRYMRSVWA